MHCLVIRDTETGITTQYNDQAAGPYLMGGAVDCIEAGVRRLQAATERGVIIAGHNAIRFDVPAIKLVYPWFNPVPYFVWDTIVLSRLIYPDLTEVDSRLKAQGRLPGKLFKKHTLEAWGHRVGLHKGDFKGPWDTWTQEMQDYCVLDVDVTTELARRLQASKLWPERTAIDLEMAVAWVIARQERHGFLFDEEKAGVLYRKLAKRRAELDAELATAFRPWYGAAKVRIPAKSSRHQVEELGLDPKAPIYEKGAGRTKAERAARIPIGYKFRTMDLTEGAAYTPVKQITFKPSSRDHVANRLTKLYGWEPTEFTDDGKAKVDETVLKGLPYPEAPKLEEFYLVLKRIGSLAEGKEAWMKHVKEDGRIHGGVNPNGAVTGRMTHMYPNMGQVPACYSQYGTECRELFCVPKRKKLTGADADALELRCLAHFMAFYDGGEYVTAVNAGKKSDGTDAHSVNARAIGIDPKALLHGKESGRDVAKTWFYAFIYGAGLEKLGSILLRVKGRKAVSRGKASREAFESGLPALKKLGDAVRKKAKKNGGYIRGLDGRWLRIRSDHAALNTLLQSAGAVLMKRALVILDTNLQEKGYAPGTQYEFVANVHDEWQIECDEGLAEDIGRMAVDAIRLAGESFGFRCPLTGEYRVGSNWAETH